MALTCLIEATHKAILDVDNCYIFYVAVNICFGHNPLAGFLIVSLLRFQCLIMMMSTIAMSDDDDDLDDCNV